MAMPRVELRLGSEQLSEPQQWQLVKSLFGQPKSIAVSGLGMLIMAAACWRHTGSLWYVAWGAGGLLILLIRLALNLCFHRYTRLLSPETWAWAFFAGAVATAVVAGVGLSLAVLLGHDLIAILYMATNVISFTGGAAVRNNASPLAARCQTLIALGFPGIACLASGNPYLQAFSVLMVFHLVAQFEIIWSLGKQALWLMDAERQQGDLARRLQETCEKLEGANDQLTRLSCTDGLTGLTNRRALDLALEAELARARRENSQLAVLMVDADHFKHFNDAHGHLAGDDALRCIARTLEASLRRPADVAGRFGGEEFVLLLPDTDALGAAEVAERIRSDLAALSNCVQSTNPTCLTVSIGVAATAPTAAENCQSLLARADKALYRAKERGRNCVKIAEALDFALT